MKPKKVKKEKQVIENVKPQESVLVKQDSGLDKEKRIKQLNKKLRQIQEIEQKQKDGKTLEPEQIQKLETKSAIEQELKELQ